MLIAVRAFMTAADIQKYLKVLALATGGVSGESDNAKKILATMEAKFPGIKAAAEAVRAMSGAGQDASASSAEPDPTAGMPAWMKETFGFVKDLASAAINTKAGSDLAAFADVSWKAAKKQGVTSGVVSLGIQKRHLERAAEMNEIQLNAYKQELARLVLTQVDEMLMEARVARGG